MGLIVNSFRDMDFGIQKYFAHNQAVFMKNCLHCTINFTVNFPSNRLDLG
jgi:hypothetical protein